jgi:hypothetical protein
MLDTKFKKGQTAWNKKIPFVRPCLNCGVVFSTKPCLARVKCCSDRCKMLLMIKNRGHPRKGKPTTFETRKKQRLAKLGRTGTLCPNFRGGYDRTERNLAMTRDAYRQWRKSVFERDDFTCQRCFKTKCKLNAHHWLSWKLHPDFRYSVVNGVTLCEPCHRYVHAFLKEQRNEKNE